MKRQLNDEFVLWKIVLNRTVVDGKKNVFLYTSSMWKHDKTAMIDTTSYVNNGKKLLCNNDKETVKTVHKCPVLLLNRQQWTSSSNISVYEAESTSFRRQHGKLFGGRNGRCVCIVGTVFCISGLCCLACCNWSAPSRTADACRQNVRLDRQCLVGYLLLSVCLLHKLSMRQAPFTAVPESWQQHATTRSWSLQCITECYASHLYCRCRARHTGSTIPVVCAETSSWCSQPTVGNPNVCLCVVHHSSVMADLCPLF